MSVEILTGEELKVHCETCGNDVPEDEAVEGQCGTCKKLQEGEAD